MTTQPGLEWANLDLYVMSFSAFLCTNHIYSCLALLGIMKLIVFTVCMHNSTLGVGYLTILDCDLS